MIIASAVKLFMFAFQTCEMCTCHHLMDMNNTSLHSIAPTFWFPCIPLLYNTCLIYKQNFLLDLPQYNLFVVDKFYPPLACNE